MIVPFLAAAPAAAALSLSPITLFLQADIIVKVVMAGLLLASIVSWAAIIGIWVKLGSASRASRAYEDSFWRTGDMEKFYRDRGKENVPSASVLSAGITEWQQSARNRNIDLAGTRDRLSTAMTSAVSAAVDRIADKLNILATIGSVSPFVGLFGTVWGIMRSFTAIAGEQNTSLAVVAPGIAEALFATAIGLFAAIPAVIAYNRFSHGVNRMEARLMRFADKLYTTFSRELEE
ncbi:MAG TPA: protein TolQ [Sphingobium sp.]|uniref:protein TolQ n=1 Tax=Sphingobium sp. TaxID=1912891 RepID=UPI002ED0199F